tara:strand:- start:50 stop:289 length:240 start_codon:yes stop_codon:yes gene_type:complete
MTKTDNTEAITKRWQRMGFFNTYEEALVKKSEVSAEYSVQGGNDLLVKIKRCGPEGSKFQVKMWYPEMIPSKKNKKKSK